MINKTPFYCLFAAMLSRITVASGVIWCFAALFSGSGNFITHDISLAWLAGTILFIINTLLFRKERTLLPVVFINIISCAAVTGLIYGFLSSDGLAMGIIMGIIVFIGAVSYIYWMWKGFDDKELTTYILLLLVAAVMEFITAGLMEKEAIWAGKTIAMAVIVICAAAASKHSGIDGSDSGKHRFKAGISAVFAAALACAAAGAAYKLASPAAALAEYIFDLTGKAAGGIVTVIGHIYIFLNSIFKSSKMAASEGPANSTGSENAYFGEPTGNLDFVKIVFGLLLALVAVIMIAAIIESLRGIMLGKKVPRSAAVKKSRREESFWSYLNRLLKRILFGIRLKVLLANNRKSIAALFHKMERRCRKNSKLRRREGETAREFITRIADAAGDDELSPVLRDFADEFDRAFYGREKDILKEFSQYKKMSKALKKTLTTRV